ncbi:hypothetical protein KASHIRA_00250 [Serratia phage vB_SmaM-Kashira]|nr:hypothetical protein KASHIRA_00250 [Serratia phage vB_SmaM-Kashira]
MSEITLENVSLVAPPAKIQDAIELRRQLGEAIKSYGKPVATELTDDVLLHFSRCNHSVIMDDIVKRMRVLSDLKKARSNDTDVLSEMHQGTLLAVKIRIDEEKLLEK